MTSIDKQRMTDSHSLARQSPNFEKKAPDWLINGRPAAEVRLLQQVWSITEQILVAEYIFDSAPSLEHARATARLVAGLDMDGHALAAALLCRIPRPEGKKIVDPLACLPQALQKLVSSVARVTVVVQGRRSATRANAESLRRMLLTIIDDVRVVPVMLADRLQLLRELKSVDIPARTMIARETLELFSPLANRLGIWQLKWELEDLSLRFIEPDAYRDLAGQLAERRADREAYIDSFISQLQELLQQVGIVAEVYGRPKHIYSIWKKMARKDVGLEQIFDVRAVRILTTDVAACYGALGVVHTRWRHISGEFDDYIATPKENNYQSIHTAVIGPNGKVVEVQIRTREMHEHNELGVAAHWRYKEGNVADNALDRKIQWLRQLLEWKDSESETESLLERYQSELFEDRVYVFTPKGNVIDLPVGSTALDFAYAIHSEVGHRCRGARVNGRIVQLTRPLQSGEQVEVLTVKNGGPSRDWLSPHLGYVVTAKAKNRIQHWFRELDHDNNVQAGRQALSRELDRVGLLDVKHEKLSQALHLRKVDDLYAGLGRGDLKLSQALAPLRSRLQTRKQTEQESQSGDVKISALERRPATGMRVHGVGNLLSYMAKCCHPVPGDVIIGHITQGHGVAVHRQDCGNLVHIRNQTPERLIEVDWGPESPEVFPVDIEITAYDRTGLLRDISTTLADDGFNVLGVNTRSDKTRNLAYMILTAEVDGLESLHRMIARVAAIPNIVEVRRKT